MAVSPQPKENLARASTKIEEAARGGAQVVCLPELFQSQYFCQREDTANFRFGGSDSGPDDRNSGTRGAKSKSGARSRLSSNGAPPASITTPPRSLTPTENSRASTARCIFRTTRSTTKSFILRRAIWASALSTRSAGKISTLICWDQWYPEGARLAALEGATFFFIRRRSAGIREKADLARRNTMRGARCSAAHAIANGIYVAAVNRVGFRRKLPRGGGDGLEFWGGSFLCDPPGSDSAEASTDREEILYGHGGFGASGRCSAQLAVSARSPD